MNGTVYFKDGHTEEIKCAKIYAGMELVTESGIYYYKNGKFYIKKIMSIELTYCGVFEPVFQFFVTDDIKKVVIPNYTIIG